MSEEQYDYTPRPGRGRKARPDAPPPAERRRAAAEETDYTPRPARKRTDQKPGKTRRPARKRGPVSRAPQKIKLTSLLRSRSFMAVIAIAGLLILVVVPVIGELARGGGGAGVPSGSPVELGDYYYRQADQRFESNDTQGALNALEQAAGYYEQALQQTPEDAQLRTTLGAVYLYQGWIYANLGQVDRALPLWQQAIDVAPGTDVAQEAEQNILQYSLQPTVGP